MTTIEIGLTFAGISSVALGIFHFPPVWQMVFTRWSHEINNLSLLSRKLINTLLIALALALLILGFATLIYAEKTLIGTSSYFWFWVLCCLFWFWRLLWQLMYFPIAKLNLDSRLKFLNAVLIVIFIINFLAYLAPIIVAVKS